MEPEERSASAVVLRPRAVWRVVFPLGEMFILAVDLNVIKSQDGNPGFWGWAIAAAIAVGCLAAFRHRVVLDGPVLRRQGTFRSYRPLDAREITHIEPKRQPEMNKKTRRRLNRLADLSEPGGGNKLA